MSRCDIPLYVPLTAYLVRHAQENDATAFTKSNAASIVSTSTGYTSFCLSYYLHLLQYFKYLTIMAAASAFSSLPEILQPKEEDIQMMLSAGGKFAIFDARLRITANTGKDMMV